MSLVSTRRLLGLSAARASGAYVLQAGSSQITPTGATGSIFFEHEGENGITSVLPPLTENTPAQRIRVHHPGSNATPVSDFIITPYEAGMGISYDGTGPIQFSTSQVAVNGNNADLPGGHGTAGQFVVADEYDSGGAFVMCHRHHPTQWAYQNYLDFYNESWAGAAHGSLHLRVADTRRTVTDGQTFSTTELHSNTAAFTGLDLGRRVTGPGIPAGAYIVNINSANDVSMNVAATASASGLTVVIGKETVDVYTGLSNDVPNQAKQLAFGKIGPASESGIMFGALEDTSLYRAAAGALATNSTLAVGGAAGTGLTMTGTRIAKTNAVAAALDLQDQNGAGVRFLNSAGTTVTFQVDNTGKTLMAKGIGVFGHAAPAAQPANPGVAAGTDAAVINAIVAILQGAGLSA